MMALIGFFLTPVGRIIGMALAIVTVCGALYYKIQSDAVSRERARVEQEKVDAINKAREARDALRSACDSDPAGCVSDDQFRD